MGFWAAAVEYKRARAGQCVAEQPGGLAKLGFDRGVRPAEVEEARVGFARAERCVDMRFWRVCANQQAVIAQRRSRRIRMGARIAGEPRRFSWRRRAHRAADPKKAAGRLGVTRTRDLPRAPPAVLDRRRQKASIR